MQTTMTIFKIIKILTIPTPELGT